MQFITCPRIIYTIYIYVYIHTYTLHEYTSTVSGSVRTNLHHSPLTFWQRLFAASLQYLWHTFHSEICFSSLAKLRFKLGCVKHRSNQYRCFFIGLFYLKISKKTILHHPKWPSHMRVYQSSIVKAKKASQFRVSMMSPKKKKLKNVHSLWKICCFPPRLPSAAADVH